MQHTYIVSGVEAGANLTRELNRFVNRKTANASKKRRKLLSLDVFHRQKVASIRLTDVVNAANVLVANLPCHAHFTMESGKGGAVAQEIIRQKLKRDRLAQLEIVGSIHLAHP